MKISSNDSMILGAGLGLRSQHLSEILQTTPDVPFFEILVDNYLEAGAKQLDNLDKIAANYPLTFHSVGLNIGSTDPIDSAYLDRYQTLIDRYQPVLISDHLAWVAVDHIHHHDLLPLPFTDEAIENCVQRIDQIQNSLGRQICIENGSIYIKFNEPQYSESEFIHHILKKSGAGLLLDLNNIFVNSQNHGFDANTFVDEIHHDKVMQIHLAGFEDQGTHLLDSHSAPVCDEVWNLYKKVILHSGPKPTVIEWDNQIPPWHDLMAQQKKANSILQAST